MSIWRKQTLGTKRGVLLSIKEHGAHHALDGCEAPGIHMPQAKGASLLKSSFFRVLTQAGFMVALFVLLTLNSAAQVAFADVTSEPQGSITLHQLQTQTNGMNPGDGSDHPTLPSDVIPLAGISVRLEKLSDDPLAGNGPTPAVDENSEPLATFTARFGVTGLDGAAVFANLPTGVYALTQGELDGVRPMQQKILVALPMDSATVAGGLWDVNLYPKSHTVASLQKEVRFPGVVYGVGATVQWRIVQEVPAALLYTDDTGVTFYGSAWTIEDLLDRRLDYKPQAQVLLKNKWGEPASDSLIMGVDILESYDAQTHRITWTIANEALVRVVNSDTTQMVLVVSNVINEHAYDQLTSIYNNAICRYESAQCSAAGQGALCVPVVHEVIKNNIPDPANGAHPRIDTGSIELTKHLANSEVLLPGAVFKIASSQENARAGVFMQRSSDEGARDIELKTDESGRAWIGGLVAGRYWLVETQAPAYQQEDGTAVTCVRLTEPLEVEIPLLLPDVVARVSIDNRLPTPIEQVIDKISSTLARTGDSAVWWVLIVGLMAVAGAALLAKRRFAKKPPCATKTGKDSGHEKNYQ